MTTKEKALSPTGTDAGHKGHDRGHHQHADHVVEDHAAEVRRAANDHEDPHPHDHKNTGPRH